MKQSAFRQRDDRDSSRLRVFVVDWARPLPRRREDAKNRHARSSAAALQPSGISPETRARRQGGVSRRRALAARGMRLSAVQALGRQDPRLRRGPGLLPEDRGRASGPSRRRCARIARGPQTPPSRLGFPSRRVAGADPRRPCRRGPEVLRTPRRGLERVWRLAARVGEAIEPAGREHDFDAGRFQVERGFGTEKFTAVALGEMAPDRGGAGIGEELDEAADPRSLSEPRLLPRRTAGNRRRRAGAVR